jgi:CRISPR system Cascade subunit CasE
MNGFVTRATLHKGAAASILLRDAKRDAGHALVWTLFEGSGARPFLYREEEGRRFLIVSSEAPADHADLWHLETKAYEPDLEEGACLSFTLRANPTRIYTDEMGVKHRVDVVMHAKAGLEPDERRSVDPEGPLTDWLVCKLAAGGARLDAVEVEAWRALKVWGRTGGRHRRGLADLTGRLTVTDPKLFGQLLFEGVGRSRAYGCGLLLVRRSQP